MMPPDAPFYVAWAGGLYFLSRALLQGSRAAWIGAGFFLGLGMFSKYTMGLMVPAAALFILTDRQSRRWLLRPEPYLALLIAALIFLPVLYWNYTHDWLSFSFQGSRRWSSGVHFSLHILLGSILILLTPVGVYYAYKALRDLIGRAVHLPEGETEKRKALFILTFSLIPLSVFVLHSLQGQPKLNWTGPVWMALLPAMALIAARQHRVEAVRRLGASRLLVITASTLIVFYAGAFGYIAAGTPGSTLSQKMKLPSSWRAMGVRVDQIEQRIERETGREPMIVGIDKYWIASQMSFYDDDSWDEPDSGNEHETAAAELFGRKCLMWDYWSPPDSVQSRDMLLISFSSNELEHNWVVRHFRSVTPITEEVIGADDESATRFYWRVGYHYTPD